MFFDNERWQAFADALTARGVTMQFMWEARRDGRRPHFPNRPVDVGMVAFTGDGFQPSVLVAVVIDYGSKDGFGLFIDGPSGKISDDVDRIATPRDTAQRSAAAVSMVAFARDLAGA